MAFGGMVSLSFLLRALRGLFPSSAPKRPTSPPGDEEQGTPPIMPPGEYDDGQGAVNFTFRVWIVIYGLVGAQMGWLLRPFIGSPDLPLEWFRVREGNFYLSLLNHNSRMLGVES